MHPQLSVVFLLACEDSGGAGSGSLAQRSLGWLLNRLLHVLMVALGKGQNLLMGERLRIVLKLLQGLEAAWKLKSSFLF